MESVLKKRNFIFIRKWQERAAAVNFGGIGSEKWCYSSKAAVKERQRHKDKSSIS
jgi:hypothetical protein